jgi:DNA-binding PadR family transcriptional regulator
MMISRIFKGTYCVKGYRCSKFKKYSQKAKTMPRGRVDIFLLRVLMLSDKNLSLREIVQKIQQLKIKKPPSRIAIYKRLTALAIKKLIDFEWNEGMKFYKISEEGLEDISEFANQFKGAELT